MNGHTPAGIAAYGGRPDDDDDEFFPQPTTIACPRCGEALEWDGYDLCCANCGANGHFPATWHNSVAVEKDRRKYAGVPSDF